MSDDKADTPAIIIETLQEDSQLSQSSVNEMLVKMSSDDQKNADVTPDTYDTYDVGQTEVYQLTFMDYIIWILFSFFFPITLLVR